MLHHVKAVTRANPNSLVVADMPYMSYHISEEETIKNAARLSGRKSRVAEIEGEKKRKYD